MRTELDLESIVSELYSPLYRFALGMTRNEAPAADLTQETFLILAQRHAQVREATKIKSWLFTTLRRQFLSRGKEQLRKLLAETVPPHEIRASAQERKPRILT